MKNYVKKHIYAVSSVDSVAREVIELLASRKKKIVTMSGLLGAGKTTLTQALLRSLGVTGLISSPTYAYVNTYDLGQNKKCHHFDLYRLESVDEFCEMGFEEYLQSYATVVIEWPGVIDNLLKKSHADKLIEVRIEYCENDYEKRKIIISG